MRTRAKVLLGVVLAVLLAGGVYVFGTRRGRKVVAAGIVAHLPGVGTLRPLTVLVLGRQAVQLTPLTDSMMLVAIDPAHRTMGVLSVARDLWVDIPGYGYSRINAAYEDGGGALAERVVRQVTGVQADGYVIVEYAGFTRLINDLGGVTVDVPHAIDDPTYPAANESAYSPLQIPAGVQHMDGQTALAFMRERHDLPLGDLSRQQDQQALLLALKAQALNPANLLHLPTLLGDLRGTFKTDLPLGDVPGYAAAVAAIPSGSIRHGLFDYANDAVSDWTTPGGQEVLLPHERAIAAVVRQVLGGIVPDIQAPTEVVDPAAAAGTTPAPAGSGSTAGAAPVPAPAATAVPAPGPVVGFVLVPGLGGPTWHAPLLASSPVVARLQQLIAAAAPAAASAAVAPAGSAVVLGLAGGAAEQVEQSAQPGTVLIAGRPFVSPALFDYLPQVAEQAPLVAALSVVGAVYAPGGALAVSGDGWVGPRVQLTLRSAATAAPVDLPLGSVVVSGGRFHWQGALPASLAAGTYLLQAGDGVRIDDVQLPVR